MGNPNISGPSKIEGKKTVKNTGFLSGISKGIRNNKTLKILLLSIGLASYSGSSAIIDSNNKGHIDTEYGNSVLDLDTNNPSIYQKYFENTGPYYNEARQAFENGDYNLAIKLYEKNLEFSSKKIKLIKGKPVPYLKSDFMSLFDDNLLRLKVKSELAFSFYKAGRHDDAINLLKIIRKENAEITKQRYLKNKTSGETEDNTAGKKIYEKTKKIGLEQISNKSKRGIENVLMNTNFQGEILFNLGNSYAKKGELENAESAYLEALALDLTDQELINATKHNLSAIRNRIEEIRKMELEEKIKNINKFFDQTNKQVLKVSEKQQVNKQTELETQSQKEEGANTSDINADTIANLYVQGDDAIEKIEREILEIKKQKTDLNKKGKKLNSEMSHIDACILKLNKEKKLAIAEIVEKGNEKIKTRINEIRYQENQKKKRKDQLINYELANNKNINLHPSKSYFNFELSNNPFIGGIIKEIKHIITTLIGKNLDTNLPLKSLKTGFNDNEIIAKPIENGDISPPIHSMRIDSIIDTFDTQSASGISHSPIFSNYSNTNLETKHTYTGKIEGKTTKLLLPVNYTINTNSLKLSNPNLEYNFLIDQYGLIYIQTEEHSGPAVHFSIKIGKTESNKCKINPNSHPHLYNKLYDGTYPADVQEIFEEISNNPILKKSRNNTARKLARFNKDTSVYILDKKLDDRLDEFDNAVKAIEETKIEYNGKSYHPEICNLAATRFVAHLREKNIASAITTGPAHYKENQYSVHAKVIYCSDDGTWKTIDPTPSRGGDNVNYSFNKQSPYSEINELNQKIKADNKKKIEKVKSQQEKKEGSLIDEKTKLQEDNIKLEKEKKKKENKIRKLKKNARNMITIKCIF